MTNNEFFEIYKKIQRENMAFYTYYCRTNLIKNHLLKDYGDLAPSDITNITINRIYDSLADSGLSANSIFAVYAALSSFFRVAVEHGEAETNPIRFANTVRPEISSERRENHVIRDIYKKRIFADGRGKE